MNAVSEQNSWMERPWVIRLPALVLCLFLLVLYLSVPYRALNSDAAVFGIMGNDILIHRYFPSLMQGQNYFLSSLPYVYAGVRAVLPPSVSPVICFALAGSLLTLTGLWLFYEALLIRLRATRERLVAGAAFCLLLLCSPAFVFGLGINSGVENMFFLIGIMAYAVARIGQAIDEGHAAPVWLWLIFGIATGFGWYCRPHVVFYSAAAMPFLLFWYRQQRHAAALALGAGLLIGILPMILHRLFVAGSWPYGLRIDSSIGTLSKISGDVGLIIYGIIPTLYSISADHLVHARISWFWLMLVPVLTGLALFRKRLKIIDILWIGGTGLILLVMALIPGISFDTEHRRHCFAMLPATAWALTTLSWNNKITRWLAIALTVVLFAAALPVWSDFLQKEGECDRALRETSSKTIPELQQHGGIFLTDYWDAYLLAFLADGRITVEAFPWELVRTYGLISRGQLQAKPHWLIKSGYGHDTAIRLEDKFGINALKGITGIDITNRLFGRECELWILSPDHDIAALYERMQPRYFQTTYPAGSKRAPF